MDVKQNKASAACININATSVLFGLSIINKAKLHLKKPLKKAKLTLTQWLVLKIIYLKRADTPSSISKSIDADPTTITRHLDTLEGQGLINRHHDVNDRRVIQLKITEKGTQVAQELYKNYAGILEDIESYLTGEDLVIWEKVKECVCKHVEDQANKNK